MGTAILYEYRRATTLRTTWVFLAISFVMAHSLPGRSS